MKGSGGSDGRRSIVDFGTVAAGALYTGVAFWSPFVAGGVVMALVLVVLLTAVRSGMELAAASADG